ncbi:hypothetical protein FPV67DRAFT_1419290 [Lyophyllum atratum]|nr:hypothetical protein FPV67DRAFT_1419290 [Lyophyllum atratum]
MSLLGVINLLPPQLHCIECIRPELEAPLDESDSSEEDDEDRTTPYTRYKPLREPLGVSVTIFTPDFGPLPGQAISLYCRDCRTRYYHNYYVHDAATIRTYFPGPSEYIQFAQHAFISIQICELFTSMMVNAWTSASNCAKIYNQSLAQHHRCPTLPARYSKSFHLTTQDTWNSLFLYWLLVDHTENDTTLQLPHNEASQALRLDAALEQRNLRMVGTGQEGWAHRCDACCHVSNDDPEHPTILHSVVVDGVTLGHPCCSVHDCMVPLASQQDHFCPVHCNQSDRCVVTVCNAQAGKGFRTCSLPDHRALEEHRYMRMRKLRPDIYTSDEGDLDNGVVSVGCGGEKPSAGNRTLKARFGRRRTHNEELCVGSCGIIMGRATFYGSEAPNGVRTFLMKLFPTKSLLPQVIWHDNNCRIRPMLAGDIDPYLRAYFEHCAMPVDVFHFKSKHKETDVDCNLYCNPYNWPELRTSEGKWRFNSSAAEQVNAWFGKFHAIVREMKVERYNFFLDEVIRRRNRFHQLRLKEQGHAPYMVPRDLLLGNNTY